MFVVAEEIKPLTDANATEVGYGGDMQPDVDWGRYIKMNESGSSVIFILRDAEGKAVGYNLFMIDQHMQCAGNTVAMQEWLYIATPHRRGTLASRLVKATDQLLALRGVEVVFRSFPWMHDMSKFLARKGYKYTETVMQKRLI